MGAWSAEGCASLDQLQEVFASMQAQTAEYGVLTTFKQGKCIRKGELRPCLPVHSISGIRRVLPVVTWWLRFRGEKYQ